MECEYDTVSRLLSLDNPTASGHYEYDYTPDRVEGRLYDKVGNRTTMAVIDSGGTKTHVYTYDDIYQITEVNYPAGYDYLATDTTFNYDDAGNRLSVIDAGGTTTYATNALNQYTSVGNATCVYDDNGNMTYDGANLYSYDPENRLTTVEKGLGPLAAACDINLTFASGGDAEWFLQTAESDYGNDAAQSGDIGDNQSTWLQATVTGPGTLRFDYKLSVESGDEFDLFIDDQFIVGHSGDCDWTQSNSYGISAGTHTIRWVFTKDSSGSAGSDCLWIDNIFWTGSLPDQEGWDWIEYTYDPSGRRVEKAVDGTTQLKFLYDGDHIIAEYDASNTLLRKYVHGPCIDEPICMIEASGTYTGTQYYHYDALSSVVAMTNSSGTVVQLYEYGIYGQVAASDPNHPNRFMFTGREFEKDTGLYYYRARYYNPEIGRFLQTDPIGYGDGMNWHAYCGNNPASMIDPSGLANKTYADLPHNHGAPIVIKLAFYNGGSPGYYISDGNRVENASGAQLREAADDFSVTIRGDTYSLAIDMNVEDPFKMIQELLKSLKFNGYYVGDIFFYDHSYSSGSHPANPEYVDGLQFGEHCELSRTTIEGLGKSLIWDSILETNCNIHFRNCYVGNEMNQDLLKGLSRWMNRTVTGGTDVGTYFGPHDAYDPTWEQEGPDYTYGDLWAATADGTLIELWTSMIQPPEPWWDPFGILPPPLPIMNPVPRPY